MGRMSRSDAQFKLRLPASLRSQLEQAASSARRSLNAELLTRLEASFASSAQQVIFDEPQPLSASAARAGLQLLCVLIKSADGTRKRQPICTLHPVPPRAALSGVWPLVLPAGLVLRPAFTSPAPRELLAHSLRLRQADSLPAVSGARA